MNTRAFTLALIISIFAMFMVYTYIDDQKSEVIRRYGTESAVIVAKVDINELELIDDSKITTVTIPQSFLMPGHFKTMKELENTMATVPILKGEQITRPRVTYPGMNTGLSRQVSAGKRAFALPVNPSRAAGLLIRPGDRIDVIAPVDFTSGQRQDMMKMQTILQDVLVLSTGYNITNSIPVIGVKTPREIRKMNLNTFEPYNNVTLELDPYQTQKIAWLLSYAGRELFIVLRNNSDQQIVRIQPTGVFDILSDEEQEAARNFFAEQYRQRN
jgi:pilus assembly protein CpaB